MIGCKIFSLFLVVMVSIESSHQDNLYTEADNLEMVRIHNLLRAKVNPRAKNIKYLKYHEDLMESAKALTLKCTPMEDTVNVSQRIYKEYGQNFQISSLKKIDLNATALIWYNERDDYDPTNSTCTSMCGHYTQMVWAKTEFMGCSATWCEKVKVTSETLLVTVCNYYPKGNIENEKPYEELKSCSDCESKMCKDVCEADKKKEKPTIAKTKKPRVKGGALRAVSSLWILVLSVPLALCKLL